LAGLLWYTSTGTVCLAHWTDCAAAGESLGRTLFLPIAGLVGYVLFRVTDAL
jgi:hypothetical protein